MTFIVVCPLGVKGSLKGLVGDLVIDSSCRESEFPALAWGGSEPSVALALGSYASDL